MKAARQRAQDFVDKFFEEGFIDFKPGKIEKELIKLLKEQDKITRHACYDAVNRECIQIGGGVQHNKTVSQCANIIINVKAV